MDFYRNEKGHNHSPKLGQNAVEDFAILPVKSTDRVKKCLWRRIVNGHIQEPQDGSFLSNARTCNTAYRVNRALQLTTRGSKLLHVSSEVVKDPTASSPSRSAATSALANCLYKILWHTEN